MVTVVRISLLLQRYPSNVPRWLAGYRCRNFGSSTSTDLVRKISRTTLVDYLLRHMRSVHVFGCVPRNFSRTPEWRDKSHGVHPERVALSVSAVDRLPLIASPL
ncbi:hypothetical protein EVAR_100890_1 [Eumeta japonica]|uniref:Uncharacterized protein n=1 Tax=Eumeta variegata TaxID=151549 RepID=A0A4C1SAW7_EUMVA|nr:hypothetical protein EVAR_100890_1 [Eumeta japonica]